MSREEFEKLKKIAEILSNYKDEVVFNETENQYTTPCYQTFIPEYVYELNMGLYAFQEQQKKREVTKELQVFYEKELNIARGGIGKAVIALYGGNNDLALDILKELLK